MPTIDIDEVKKDLGDASAIDTLANTEGGQLLIQHLESDIIFLINNLRNYRGLSHVSFIEIASALSSKLDLLAKIKSAEKEKEMLIDILKQITTN